MGDQPAFVNEESLTELFASLVWDAIPRKNGCKHPLVMREVDCNRGRADIVCAVSHDNNFDLHKASHLGIALSEFTKACILSWLNKSSLRTETYIQEMTGLGQKTIRKHLRGLIEAGLVDTTTSGLFRLAKSFALPNIEIWSFEVKLHDWKRAIYQALRYRGFSHRIIVVMPAGNSKIPTKNINLFREMNIGLMSIDQHGKLEFIEKPLREKPSSKKHYLYALGQVISEFCRLYPDYQYKSKAHAVPQLKGLFSQDLFHIR